MSSEEMVKRGIVLKDITIAERQGSGGVLLRPVKTGERRVRRIKLSEIEQQARESRQRQLDRNAAERQKVKEDLRRAIEQQEQSKRTAPKVYRVPGKLRNPFGRDRASSRCGSRSFGYFNV